MTDKTIAQLPPGGALDADALFEVHRPGWPVPSRSQSAQDILDLVGAVVITPHTHPISDITGLQTALDAKGPGDMLIVTYDPNGIAADAFDMDNMVEGAATKILTATERTKLAGVETGAEVNDTAAEILTKLLTVDGAASGLDADLLDGQSSAAFAAAAHTHVLANITDAGAAAAAGVKQSLEINTGDIHLVGDTAAPGNNKVYGTDGAGARGWKADPAGGVGDVVGPAGATDGHAALFDGATGKLVKTAGWAPQQSSALLAAIAALTPTDGVFIVGDGVTFVGESGATARTSIGLGTAHTPQFTGIELGHATDTTITRVSAGKIAVEGVNVVTTSSTDTLTNKTLTSPTVNGITNGTGLAAGVYTPTLTNFLNVAASTAFQCQYMRVGSVVTVSGKVQIDPTAGSTATVLGISLPIASNFGAEEDCSGTAFCEQIVSKGAGIYGYTTGDYAFLYFINDADVANRPWRFSFTYRVI